MLIELPVVTGGTIWINPEHVTVILSHPMGQRPEHCDVYLGDDTESGHSFVVTMSKAAAASEVNAACNKEQKG